MSEPVTRNSAHELLVLALTEPAEIANLDAADLDLLIRLLRLERLHGRVAADLQNAGLFDRLPQAARDQFEGALTMARARERVACWELDRIALALRDTDAGPLICMKGAAYLLLGLPNTPGRIFADVDLLVAEDRLEAVERHLNRRGWRTRPLNPYDDNYYRRWTHELPPLVHAEREVEVDLHHNILPRTARLKPASGDIVEAAVPIPNSAYYAPADTDIVLHAMVHLTFDSDFVDKLRDLVDIRDLLHFFGAEKADFWTRLVARAELLDLARPAYYGIRYAQRILGLDLPAVEAARIETWGPPAPVRWLMDRLVTRAILPANPDSRATTTALCRLSLYMRSHWLRMPPWLLAYHLTVKFFRTRIRRETVPESVAD